MNSYFHHVILFNPLLCKIGSKRASGCYPSLICTWIQHQQVQNPLGFFPFRTKLSFFIPYPFENKVELTCSAIQHRFFFFFFFAIHPIRCDDSSIKLSQAASVIVWKLHFLNFLLASFLSATCDVLLMFRVTFQCI